MGDSVGSIYIDLQVKTNIQSQVQQAAQQAGQGAQNTMAAAGQKMETIIENAAAQVSAAVERASQTAQHSLADGFSKGVALAQIKVQSLAEQLESLNAKSDVLRQVRLVGTGDNEYQKIVAQSDAVATRLRNAEQRLTIEKQAEQAKRLKQQQVQKAREEAVERRSIQRILDMNERRAAQQQAQRDREAAKRQGMPTQAAAPMPPQATRNLTPLQQTAGHFSSLFSEVRSKAAELPAMLRESVARGVGKIPSLIGGAFKSGIRTAANFTKVAASGFGQLTKAVGKCATGIGKGNRGMQGFGTRLRSIVSGALIFNGISAALRGLMTYFKNAMLSSSQMRQALGQLKGAATTAAAPIAQMLTPALTALANMAALACTWVAKLFSALTGKSVASMQAAAKATKAYGSSAGMAAKKAKELAKANNTLGIDELNVVQPDREEESDNTGGGIAPDYSALNKKLPDFAQALIDTIKAGKWADAGKLLGDKVNQLVDEIDGKAIGKKIGQALQNGISFLHSSIETIDWKNIGAKIADFLNNGLEQIDGRMLGQLLVAKFVIALEGLNGFVQRFDYKQFAVKLSDGIKGAFDRLTQAVAEFDWNGLGKKIQEFLVNIDWAGIFVSVATFAGSLLGAAIETFKGLLGDAWNTLVAWWHEVAFEDGKFTISGLLDGILEIFSTIGQWIKEHIFQPFVDGFKKVFEIHSPSQVMKELGIFLIDGLFGGIGETWEKIKKFFGDALGNVKKAFGDTWDALLKNTKDLWKDIGDSIKGAINGIIGFVNGLIQGVCDGINRMVDALNAFHFEIPDDVPFVGGTKFGLSLDHVSAPQIPMLANGGVIKQPTLAMMGEYAGAGNNPEIVAPESKLREIFGQQLQPLLEALHELLRALAKGDQKVTIEQPIQLLLDGNVLYEVLALIDMERGTRIGGAFSYAR